MGKSKIIILVCFLLLSAVSLCQWSTSDSIWIAKDKSKYDYKVFTKPYNIVRIDEHELQLINKKDTVVLYLENAYQFKERIVYIKK
jgi:hypothetical protein